MATISTEIPLRTDNQRELVFAHRPVMAFFVGIAILAFAYFVYTLITVDVKIFRNFRDFFAGLFALMGLAVMLSVFWRFRISFNLMTRAYEVERGYLTFVKKWHGKFEELGGIVLTSRVEHDSSNDQTKTVWHISLEFKELKKPVCIFSGSEQNAYEKLEYFAKKLRIKTIDKTGLKPRETGWDELDRKVRDREEAAVSILSPPPPDSGITYREAPGPAMVILPPNGLFSVWLLVLLFSLPFACVGLAVLWAVIFRPERIGQEMTGAVALGMSFSLVGVSVLGLALGAIFGRRVLIDDKDGIVSAIRLFKNRLVFKSRVLKREVEEVSIKPILKTQRHQSQMYEVFVRSDRKTLHIWRRSAPEELEWLKNAVLNLVRR